MKLVKLLLLLPCILLVWETKASAVPPPTEVPCTTDESTGLNCSEKYPEASGVSQRSVITNSTAPNVEEFVERLNPVRDEIQKENFSVPVTTESSDKNATTHSIIQAKSQESSQAGFPQENLPSPEKLVTEETNNPNAQLDESIRTNQDLVSPSTDEARLGESQINVQSKDNNFSDDSQDDRHVGDDLVDRKSESDRETSVDATRGGESEGERSQDKEIFKNNRKFQDGVITGDDQRENPEQDNLLLVDDPQQKAEDLEQVNEQTFNETQNEIRLEHSSSTALPMRNDSSVLYEAINFDEQQNSKNISVGDDDDLPLDILNQMNNSSSDKNIAKSIENGYSNSTSQESRSLDVNRPVDMTFKSGDKIKLDDATAHKENFTLRADDQLDAEDSNEHKLDEVAFEEPQGSADISSEVTYVRKCCEEEEYFSLETQQCEEADRDTGFMNFAQELLLLPSSTGNLQLATGRLQLCPGTTEPPLVSEAKYDTHSLQTFGHLRDEDFNVKYDHDHYCLELAAITANLSGAVFVLAHCIPDSNADASEALIIKTSVRKCCGEQEFFSTQSQRCEPAGSDPGFQEAVRMTLMNNSTADIDHITGLLQECPVSGAGPELAEAHPAGHSVLPVGHLMDHNSKQIYDHDHYCLELAAYSRDQLASAPIAIAYCHPYKQESRPDFSTEAAVRKCCGDNEFFSLQTKHCEPADGESGFEEYIEGIYIDNSTSNLKYINGRLQWCASSSDLPLVSQVHSESHAILSFGHLKDLNSGIKYDHDNYCLELAAEYPSELSNGILMAAYCPVVTTQIVARKCCSLNQYFDHATLECRERLENMTNYSSLVNEFLLSDPSITSASIKVGQVKCNNNVIPKPIYADDTYLDSSGQLCIHTTGVCHPPSSYCIEHIKMGGDSDLTAGGFVCPSNVFHKCCSPNEILTDSGCKRPSPEYIVSSQMTQLKEIMEPQTGFQKEGDGVCTSIQKIVKSSDNDVRWWVNRAGYLSIRATYGKTTTKRYCVDDFQDHENVTHTAVIMCLKEMERILPIEMVAHYTNVTSFGKCCPHGYYLQGSDCIPDTMGLDLIKEPQFKAANITNITYSSFPICQSVDLFHKYPFGQNKDDYAVFSSDRTMQIVSLEHGCFISQQSIRSSQYCIEYDVVDQQNFRPIVFVCSDIWDSILRYQEKYSLTAVLLGISCTALTATAFSLVSMRVRRGLFTVKKVNTLAGRILLSYVLSYLMAFLLLAIGMKTNTQVGYSCSVLAGFLIFFLLAAFQWNTSICLESLLLTLSVSVSESRRYLCHSLWAWGVPGIITSIALTLDYHKESLPCSVIIPRIGLYRCFFSDRNAQLLYLYLPMFLSLLANMCLLTAARYVRSAKLRKLELGGRGRSPTTPAEGTELQDQQRKNSTQSTGQTSQQTNTQHSGLRTHQTRNLWTESMKLVVWSGATWMAEVTSFLLTRFVVLSESWYNYLWYLPSSINSLRGVGIFVILVLTPENRLKIFKAVWNIGSWAGSGSLARHSRSGDAHSSSGNHQTTVNQTRGGDMRNPGRRNMSIATTVTQISSIRSGETRSDIGLGQGHPRVAHSVSQIDTRRPSASSMSSEGEGSEYDAELGAGGRRKSSLANFAMVSLPSVDEEDVFEGTTAIVHPTPHEGRDSTSDV